MDGSQFKFVKFLGFLYMILDLILEQEKFEMAIIVPEFPVGHPWGVRPGHGEFEKVEGGSRDRGGHGLFNPVDGTDAAQVWIKSGLFTNSILLSRLFTIKSHQFRKHTSQLFVSADGEVGQLRLAWQTWHKSMNIYKKKKTELS